MNKLPALLLIFALLFAAMPVGLAQAQASEQPASLETCSDPYTVVRGDSLAKIARKCGVSLSNLLAYNPQLKNPNVIYAGQQINLTQRQTPTPQPGQYYTVQPGDTMAKIARRFNISLSTLLNANPNITNPNRIYVGQQIFIPGSGVQTPSISISPSSGLAGVNVTVSAAGLQANEVVNISFGPSGGSATASQDVTTSSGGAASATFQVPGDAAANSLWTGRVSGRNGALNLVSANFQVIQSGQTPPPAGDPATQYGNPTWQDDFDDPNDWNWLLGTGGFTDASISGGRMNLIAKTGSDGWRITWRSAENYYLEMTVNTGQCRDNDRYGLFVHVPTDRSATHTGYLYTFTCSGSYSLREWNGSAMTELVGWTQSNAINTGQNATNRIGIQVKGQQMSLYANGQFLQSVSDSTFTGPGRFGITAAAPSSGNYTVYIDQMRFWNLDQ